MTDTTLPDRALDRRIAEALGYRIACRYDVDDWLIVPDYYDPDLEIVSDAGEIGEIMQPLPRYSQDLAAIMPELRDVMWELAYDGSDTFTGTIYANNHFHGASASKRTHGNSAPARALAEALEKFLAWQGAS